MIELTLFTIFLLASTILACDPGTYLEVDSCLPCPEMCSECSAEDMCTSCAFDDLNVDPVEGVC